MVALVEDTYELADLLADFDGDADSLGGDWWDWAVKWLNDHQIERYLREPDPSVGRTTGISARQRAFWDAFQSGVYRVMAGSGANQSGKTIIIACCFCWYLREMAVDGDAFWVIAQSHDTIRDIPQKSIWDLLPRSMFPDDMEYEPRLGFGQIPTLQLTLPEGRGMASVWFKTEEMDVKKFESSRLKGIWWTECRRQALYDALFPRLAANHGWLLMDYVPTEAWHRLRVADPAETGANKSVYHTRFCMKDNAHNLPPGEIDFQRANMTDEEAAVRIDGEDGSAFGVVVKEFRDRPESEGGHLFAAGPLDETWPLWVYIDVGKYTAALLLTVGDDGRKRVWDEVYTLGFHIEANVDEIVAMLMRNDRQVSDVLQFKMDPNAWSYSAANTVTIGDQYIDCGIPVSGWPPTQSAKGGEEAMLTIMRRDFQHHGLLVADRCSNTRLELKTWKHKTDRDGRIEPKDRYEGHNHTIDCMKAWVSSNPMFEPLSPQILDMPEF